MHIFRQGCITHRIVWKNRYLKDAVLTTGTDENKTLSSGRKCWPEDLMYIQIPILRDFRWY